ncbi:hypothetical protein GCM10022206_87920 [Streptomyces chiangmaiensis]
MAGLRHEITDLLDEHLRRRFLHVMLVPLRRKPGSASPAPAGEPTMCPAGATAVGRGFVRPVIRCADRPARPVDPVRPGRRRDERVGIGTLARRALTRGNGAGPAASTRYAADRGGRTAATTYP